MEQTLGLQAEDLTSTRTFVPLPLPREEQLLSSAPSWTHLGQPVKLRGALHSHVPAQVGKFDLDEFPRVQGAVPVPAETQGQWETRSGAARQLEGHEVPVAATRARENIRPAAPHREKHCSELLVLPKPPPLCMSSFSKATALKPGRMVW